MANRSLKLIPGVEQNETPALNEAGISSANLIRFAYDKAGNALVEKLGGWQKFYGQQLPAPVRALSAWEDVNANLHLAIGTQSAAGVATLGVVTNGSMQTITPRCSTELISPVVSTTAGSAVVTITDTTTQGITSYDTVYIQTHISIGGLILFGLYPCITQGTSTYQINAVDIYGTPTPAASSSTAPATASFATTSGSAVVTVTLPNHGFVVGSTYTILSTTQLGGVTLYGNYTVTSVPSSSTFTIQASQQAASSASGGIGGNGYLLLTYSYGVGAVPAGSGYGVNGYGSGGYGVGAAVLPAVGNAVSASDWTLDNWGPILVACPVSGGQYQPIYVWDPAMNNPTATILANAPVMNDGVFVAMPERQIVAWGSTDTGIQDPLLVRWCDILNYNTWASTPTNAAGKYRISKGSRIVGGMQGPQRALIWTDVDLWAMDFVGGEIVYGFTEISSGCGLIGRKAMGVLGESVYWMSVSQFYVLSGGGVSVLPCDVRDFVFQNLDASNTSKIRCAPNSRFNEVGWFFPTLGSGGEVAAYVKYNTLTRTWDTGYLARSAWIDQSVLGAPIGADPNLLYVYQHETSNDADGAALTPSFTTGWAAMDEADVKTFVDRVWPDMKWGSGGQNNATVQLTFYACDYPGDTPQAFGPYSVTKATEYISPRLRGRLIAISVASSDIGSFWRLGNIRYRCKSDGKN